jgi:transposase-like protein
MEAYMIKIRRHKRCPYCAGFNTKKFGYKSHKRTRPDHSSIRLARWFCKSCKKTFINSNSIFAIDHAKDAAELYFDAKASYRSVAKVLGIHKMTAYDHIQEVCQRAKMPWELSKELNPTWSGYIAIDSNTINVFKFKKHLQISVDTGTRDIPNAILAHHDDAPNWTLMLTMLKDQLSYPFKGIVSDGDSSIISAVNSALPNIKHQICVRHFENEMYRFLQYRKHRIRVDAKLSKLFMKYLHEVLYAKNIYDYKYELYRLLKHSKLKHPDLKDAVTKLQHAYKYLTPHFFDRNIPRTNNIAENVISQLDLKINQIVKFQSHETAWNTIKLLISWYRFKKFSSCRKRNRKNNGHSPLELAQANLNNKHWIYQAIRQLSAT